VQTGTPTISISSFYLSLCRFAFQETKHTADVAMNISIDNTTVTPVSTPKARLLRGLVRHVSAPARPQITLRRTTSNREFHRISKEKPPLFQRSLATSLRSKPDLLSELSLAQSNVSRLCIDRDEWRTTAKIQEGQLLANERELEHQGYRINALEGQNVALQAEHEEVVSANNRLFVRLRDAVSSNDRLVGQLKDADRRIVRLKKSDRAKGKVWQRNLRLKAMLHQYTSQTASSPSQRDTSTETSLLEALASASERIEELEKKGNALLDVLEQRNNSCGNDKNTDHNTTKLLDAETELRGVLEDEDFILQREHWVDLLRE
jgi:myosin heavy subunit